MAAFAPGDVDFTARIELPPRGRLKERDDLVIVAHLTIKEPTLYKILTGGKAEVTFAGSAHFAPSQAAVRSLRGRDTNKPEGASELTLRCVSASRNIDTISPEIELALRWQGQDVASCRVQLGVQNFALRMFPENLVRAGMAVPSVRNILLFGTPGSGKSTFVNTVYSLLSTHCIPEMAISGGSDGHVSTTFRGYQACAFEDRAVAELARFRLFDTWGLEHDNYSETLFWSMLDGTLPTGAQMQRISSLERAGRDTPTEQAIQLGSDNRVHCVVFLISCAEADAGDSVELLKEYVQALRRRDISCVLAVTQCDRLDPDYPLESLESAAVVRRVGEAADALGIARNCVLPLVGYAKHNTKNFFIDKLAFKVVDMALRIADANAARQSLLADDGEWSD